jgi:hypothetical protein
MEWWSVADLLARVHSLLTGYRLSRSAFTMSSVPFLLFNHARRRSLCSPLRYGLQAAFLIALLHAKLISLQVFLWTTKVIVI